MPGLVPVRVLLPPTLLEDVVEEPESEGTWVPDSGYALGFGDGTGALAGACKGLEPGALAEVLYGIVSLRTGGGRRDAVCRSSRASVGLVRAPGSDGLR